MATKHFFGYFRYAGSPLAIAVVEEDGKAIGGNIDFIEGNKHEITEEEFWSTLSTLSIKYPFKEPTPKPG